MFLFKPGSQNLFFRGVEKLGGFVPIDDVPPGLDVVATEVLILQIVGMLPNIQAQNSLAVSREQVWGVLVRC